LPFFLAFTAPYRVCYYASAFSGTVTPLMRSHLAHIAARVISRLRQLRTPWWGGIGCRISFLISLAICLVVTLLGTYLFWEGKRNQQTDLRSRVYFIGSYFSSLALDDILSEDRQALYRKLIPAFQSRGSMSNDLVYLVVYDRTGRLLAADALPDVGRDRFGEDAKALDTLDAASQQRTEPHFRQRRKDLYELTMPVMFNGTKAGFVKVGISGRSSQEQLDEFTRNALIVVVPILLVGLLFSQLIAAGIIKPITRLGAAVDELGRQNWRSPIPVQGKDEISRLATAFNHMAAALKQRETSLSQGNRDLFLLHTAGLDLMESLDLRELLGKIAARAEDLIRADTTSVASVDRGTRVLRYLGIEGERAEHLAAQELPLEAGGIYNWLASYGTPLLVQDAATDFRLDSELMKSLGVRSLIAVPLWSSNVMIGVLTAINKKGNEVFDKHDLRLFTVFSSIAGAALQNAFLYDDLKNKMDELRNTQQQLVRSTKMAAIGELAANVAHEINNPLTSVLGYTSHLIRNLNLPDESLQKLRLVEQETLRVRKIIRNLLDFSRQRMSWKQPGDVMRPLKETVALLQGVADRSSVRIREEYPEGPVVLIMDHNELKQVFLNIMNNALQAMPQGGTLWVKVGPSAERRVAVEFEDTGHGIPDEHLGKIFEPFFSTRNVGYGTGLGLSISERIVQAHGGMIEVTSTVGRGTVFRVLFPVGEQSLVNYE
jgi:signal transduction histidine kinase